MRTGTSSGTTRSSICAMYCHIASSSTVFANGIGLYSNAEALEADANTDDVRTL